MLDFIYLFYIFIFIYFIVFPAHIVYTVF